MKTERIRTFAISGALSLGMLSLCCFGQPRSSNQHDSLIQRSIKDVSSGAPLKIAVIAGIDDYSFEPLEAAKFDIKQLNEIFVKQLNFDEVITLKNEAFNRETLDYFLTSYLPSRFDSAPDSQFVFAFSGHGAESRGRGWIIAQNAASKSDIKNGLPLPELREKLLTTIGAARQSLVLINSCFSGNFLSATVQNFSDADPNTSGAHAIMASSGGELSYSDRQYGKGSIFFEAFKNAISNGAADISSYEAGPGVRDGLVSYPELVAYLDTEVHRNTSGQQNLVEGPLMLYSHNGALAFKTSDTQVGEKFVLSEAQKMQTKIAFGELDASVATRISPSMSRLTRYVVLNQPIYRPGETIKIKINANSSQVRALAVFNPISGVYQRVDAKFAIEEAGVFVPYKLPVSTRIGHHSADVIVNRLRGTDEERFTLHFEVIR